MELIQNKEGLVATLTVKILHEDYATQVEKELKKLRQTAIVKGFRPGNAPMSLIKKLYKRSVIAEELQKLVLESVKNYEQENEGHLFAQVIPSPNGLSFTDMGERRDYEFIYEAGFIPEFTYKIDENTELPYYNIIVEDDAIDVEIEAYRELYTVTSRTETEIQDDCLVDVDVVMIKGGEEIIQHADFLMTVIPDEYKSLFLGAKVDDTVNVEIRKVFTNEVDLAGMLAINKEELALQPETLPFTVMGINKKVPAELNQSFFDNIAGRDNVHSEAELREHIKKALIKVYGDLSLDQLYDDSFGILLDKADISMPDDFIRKYLRFVKKENDEISDKEFEYMTQCYIIESKWKYIMTSLLDQHGLDVTYEMIRNEAKRIVKRNFARQNKYYTDSHINVIVNYYLQNEEYVHSVVNKVKQNQLAALLKKYAKLNVTDVTLDEFYVIRNGKENSENQEDQANSENQENIKEDNKEEGQS
jgi:trigger factor